MTEEISLKIINALEEHYGPAKAELRYKNLYQLTIAVILSAQTTDRQVNSVTPELFAKYPDFHALSLSRTSDVRKIIRTTGFFRNKSEHIVKLAKTVISGHGGRIPDSFEELTSLPGIGRKSANVILLIGFGKPAFPVDTHVFRIANRIGYVHSEKLIDAEKSLCRFIPEKKWRDAHLLLIRHGRTICRARKPLCDGCPVCRLCESGPLFPR